MTTHEPERTLEEKYQLALQMLADWAMAVDQNGTGWDDWDEYYKDVLYRNNPIRKDLDNALYVARRFYENDDDDS